MRLLHQGVRRNSLQVVRLAAVLTVAGALAVSAGAQPASPSLQSLATTAMKKVRDKKLTPQQAWDAGLLDKELLFYILDNESLVDRGQGLWWPGQESYSLTELLLKQSPELEQDAAPTSTNVAIRIALLRMNRGEARGAEAMEKMLDAMPRENADMLAVNAILSNLSGYYRSRGQNAKALATSLKVKEFSKDPNFLSNIVFQAANAAYEMGDKKRAQELYDEVIGYGYGWASGHAYSTMARHAFANGQLEKGRSLLKTPIIGLNGDQIRVFLNMELAESYMSTGEWDEARHYAQATIDQFNAIAVPLEGYGLEYMVKSAQALPARIEAWQKRPLRISQSEIVENIRYREGVTKTGFQVESYTGITLKAVANNDGVKVKVREPDEFSRRGSAYVGLEINNEAFDKDSTVLVTVTVKEIPGASAQVTLNIRKALLAAQ